MKTRTFIFVMCGLVAVIGVVGITSLWAAQVTSVPVTVDKPAKSCDMSGPQSTWRNEDPLDLLMPRYFLQVIDDLDRKVGDFGMGIMPEMDIVSTADEYLVQVDLPGMKKDEIAIEISGDILTVSGHRKDTWKEENKEKGEYVYRTGQRYGEFSRSIKLPLDTDVSSVKATYENGVLEIHLAHAAKKEETVKKIEIM